VIYSIIPFSNIVKLAQKTKRNIVENPVRGPTLEGMLHFSLQTAKRLSALGKVLLCP